MFSASFINPRSNPELRSLYEIIRLSPRDHLKNYFLEVMTLLAEHFSVNYSALFLQNSQKDSFHIEALYGVENASHPATCSCQKGIMGKVIESRQPMAIQNLSEEPLYEEMMKAHQKRHEKIQPPLLCIPLVAEGEPMGVINMNSLYGPRQDFVEDFQFLSILAAIVSPVVKNYQRRKTHDLLKDHPSDIRSRPLDKILEQKLAEVLYKIDPYVETKAKMGIFDDMIRVVEKILIKSALERVNHVQRNAAQLLGINRNTLRRKIKEFKIKMK